MLTPRQARALAGEWYDWFLARHPISDLQKWENLRDHVNEALREAVGDGHWEQNNPDDLWREDEELRTAVRPVLADLGETSQFLGMKRMALNNGARDRFLDDLYDDLAAAFHRLIGISQGDYSLTNTESAFRNLKVPMPARRRGNYLKNGCPNANPQRAVLKAGATYSGL